MAEKRQIISSYILWLVCSCLAICGCSTIRTTDLPPEQLHNQIISNKLIHNGDHVTIITVDGTRHQLKISEVSAERVLGEETIERMDGSMDENSLESVWVTETQAIEIKIVDIIAIETKEPTVIGGIIALAAAIIMPYVIIVYIPELLFMP